MHGAQERNNSSPTIEADEIIRQLAKDLCVRFSERCMDDGLVPIVKPGDLTPTDVMMVCTALLRSVDIQVFELGMWQGWNGV